MTNSKPTNQKEKKINKPTGLIFDKSTPPREERVKVKYDDFKKALDKTNNPEDLGDWCCTEVYRLDNGEDVWKQINKVHQLALREQREEMANNFYEYGWDKLEASYYNDPKDVFIKNFLESLKEKK